MKLSKEQKSAIKSFIEVNPYNEFEAVIKQKKKDKISNLVVTGIFVTFGTMALSHSGIIETADLYPQVNTQEEIEYNRENNMYVRDDLFMKSRFSDKYLVNTDTNLKFLVSKDISEEYFQYAKEAAEYLNSIFEVINPEYKFTVERLNFTNAITGDYLVFEKDLSNSNHYAAMQANMYFGTIFSNKINKGTIDVNVDYIEKNYELGKIEDRDSIGSIFLHEFTHILGLNDVSSLSANPSIMANGLAEGIVYGEDDLQALASLYGDLSTPEKRERIEKFIAEKTEEFQQNYSYNMKKLNKDNTNENVLIP